MRAVVCGTMGKLLQQRLTLRHDACDRGMFADGVVEAVRILMDKPAGLYNMTQLLEMG